MSEQPRRSHQASAETFFLRSLEKFHDFIEFSPLEITVAENLHPEIKSQTISALEAIGKFLHVEQSYICYRAAANQVLQLVQWSHSPDQDLVVVNPKPQTKYKLYSKTIQPELIFVGSERSSGTQDQDIFRNAGISSTLHIPMFLDDSIQGWLGFHGFQTELDISKGLIMLIWMFGLILVGGLENPSPEEPDYHDSSPFWKYLRQFDFASFSNGHSNQLIDITLQIAENIGLSQKTMDTMLQGAFLHDVGKFTIPEQILEKREQLTQEEIQVIKYHPSIAYDLLSQIPVLKHAVEIPHCHHEYWNGSGYPRGLKGEEIPLEARIFAIVDVYDALCSDRPYREAWRKSDAINYIKYQAGIQFDPAVVPEFLKVVGAK
jgi:HD-GYP domain-containing protein (c-di-GMP phosphodiesterase class II)